MKVVVDFQADDARMAVSLISMEATLYFYKVSFLISKIEEFGHQTFQNVLLDM